VSKSLGSLTRISQATRGVGIRGVGITGVGAIRVGAIRVGAIRVGATMVGAIRGATTLGRRGATTVGRRGATMVGRRGATGRGGTKGIIAAKPPSEGIVNGRGIKPNGVGKREGITVTGGVKGMRPGIGAVVGLRVAFPNQPVKPVVASGEPRNPP